MRTPGRLDQDLALTGFVSAGPPYPILIEIAGDPKFESEKLLGYEAGYRTLVTKRLYVDFVSFYNVYHDLESFGTPSITIPSTPVPPHILITVPWANGIKGHTTGFEIAPDWSITKWWQLKGSYSFLHMSLDNEPGNGDTGTVATDLGSSPHHEVVLQSLVNLPKRFEFDTTYRFVSALPAQAVKAYNTADARLGWHIGEGWECSLAGANLLQPFHTEFNSSPGPIVAVRRSAYVTFLWRGR